MNFRELSGLVEDAEEHLQLLKILEGPQKWLGNGLSQALEFLLESMQPYPGNPINILQKQGQQFCVMQISEGELVVTNCIFDTDNILAMDVATNTQFEMELCHGSTPY
ncbi:hypothetical protein C0989_001501 [Termitomyces sp. Mn162]|nr:hypothetical protein C0989_001501 [Termitomyces sp. Mn162]